MGTRGKYIYVLLLSTLLGMEIEGRVTDKETGLPIPAVTIRADGRITSTDNSGNYILQGITSDTEYIEASHIAYQSSIKPAERRVNFHLNPKIEDLEPIKIKGKSPKNSIHLSNLDALDNKTFLRKIPSLSIKEGRSDNITIRGSEGILVIVDGRELSQDHMGNIDLSEINGNIESAELIVNNIPTKYSAKASQAVLLITTKSIDTKLKASAGSFDSYDLSLQTDIKNISLSLKASMSEGDFPFEYRRIPDSQPQERNRQNNSRRNLFLSFNPRFDGELLGARMKHIADISFGWLREGMPGDLDQPTPEAERELSNLLLYTNSHFMTKNHNLALSLNIERTWSNIYSPTPYVYVPVDSDYMTDQMKFAIDYSTILSEILKPSAGFEYTIEGYAKENNLNHDNDLERVSRPLPRLYGQIGMEKKSNDFLTLSLNPGLSLDFPEDGYVLSPQIEAVFFADIEPIRLGLSSGWRSAYRSPSFTDLYWQRDAFSEGNENLAPERSETSHIRLFAGLEEGFIDLNLSFDVWHSVTDSVISWNRGFDGLYRPLNLGTEKRYGQDHLIDLLLWEILHLRWSNTLIHTEHISNDRYLNGKELPFVPSHLEKWEIGVERFGFALYLAGMSKGKEYILPANTKWTEAYSLYDAGLSYTHTFDNFDIYTGLHIENIIDTQYQTMPGYPGLGRGYELVIQFTKGVR